MRVGLAPRAEWWWGRHVWHRSKVESGVAAHQAHPNSFWIPDDDEKELLRPGDRVKLMWSIQNPKRGWASGERRWVTIADRDGDKLVGTIENWPVFAYLHPEEEVSFRPDDTIDCILVDEAAEPAEMGRPTT